MRTWNVGDITVTSIVEAEGPTPGRFLFAEADPETIATRHAWARGRW